MRKQYQFILKHFFYNHLIRTRASRHLTQAQMAKRLAMDDRSYADLDRGKSCCGALTLMLYLMYFCDDANAFISELRTLFELGGTTVA